MSEWYNNPDMGHGFFVPVVAGYIAWGKRSALARLVPQPNWWGLAIVIWAGLQLYIATLGAELFLARTSFVISLIGVVLLLGGTQYLKILLFPLFLLFFMVPIPAIIYNSSSHFRCRCARAKRRSGRYPRWAFRSSAKATFSNSPRRSSMWWKPAAESARS